MVFADEMLSEIPREEMTGPIHKHIGVLLFESEHTIAYGKGTAMLISPNLALTCAHNIFNRRTGEQYCKIKFFPGQAGVLERPMEVDKVFFPA